MRLYPVRLAAQGESSTVPCTHSRCLFGSELNMMVIKLKNVVQRWRQMLEVQIKSLSTWASKRQRWLWGGPPRVRGWAPWV